MSVEAYHLLQPKLWVSRQSGDPHKGHASTRLRVMGQPVCNRMGHGDTARRNRPPSELGILESLVTLLEPRVGTA